MRRARRGWNLQRRFAPPCQSGALVRKYPHVLSKASSARSLSNVEFQRCFDACGSARMRLLYRCNSALCSTCSSWQWRWMRCKLVMSGVRPTGVPHRVHHRAGFGLLRLHGRQARPCPRERGLVQVLQEDRHRQPVCTQVPRVCFCLWMRASAPVHVRKRRQAGCHIGAERQRFKRLPMRLSRLRLLVCTYISDFSGCGVGGLQNHWRRRQAGPHPRGPPLNPKP